MHWTSEHDRPLLRSEREVPGPAAIAAAVSLLADSDARIATQCWRRVLSWGIEALPQLREAAEGSDPLLRVRARALLRRIDLQCWNRDMRRFTTALRRIALHSPRDPRVLETGALLIGSIGRLDRFDRGAAIAQLEGYGERLRDELRGKPETAASAARSLGELLGQTEGFCSRAANHYDGRRLRLDAVLGSRCGVPAVLALIYAVVARHAGLAATAVQVPGSMLVKVHGPRSALVDPARGGIVVTRAECMSDLRKRGYTGPKTAGLTELSDRQLLQRLLESLRSVYGYREDSDVLRSITSAIRRLA